jgi:hypothetical protein
MAFRLQSIDHTQFAIMVATVREPRVRVRTYVVTKSRVGIKAARCFRKSTCKVTSMSPLSPLLRGMLLSVAYAGGEGGIGLTATGAMNRKFVHWAAVNFLWPGYTHDELFSVNKVLNESDMPPLWAVRDFLHFSRFTRRLAALQFTSGLHLGDDRQHVVQPLVLDDFRRMHRSQLVEGCVGQGEARIHNLQTSIRIITDNHFLSRQRFSHIRRVENEQNLVITQRQGL